MKSALSHPQMEIFGVNSYHNSVHIVDQKLLERREKRAQLQDQIILDFMRDHCMESFTPPQLHNRMRSHPTPSHIIARASTWPTSSVRRALTNLTKEGWLMVTGEKRKGDFDDNNNCWQFAGKLSRS